MLQIQPSYTFWSPYIGPKCKKSKLIVNSEFQKANHKANVTSNGTLQNDLSMEKIMDLFCESQVMFFILLCH
jgi:hypothetical protein